MFSALCSANLAMLAQQARETVVSHNLANLNTVGFKADVMALESFPPTTLLDRAREEPVGTAAFGVGTGQTGTNWDDGVLVSTGRSLDVALCGSGFFVVQDSQGENRYTRNGTFSVNPEGYLVNEQDYLVQGQDGDPIRVGTEGVMVKEDGEVMAGGKPVGRLLVEGFAELQSLTKVGDNLFRAEDQAQPSAIVPRLRSGYLEQSNTEVVGTMIDLMSAFRAYEAAQRVLRGQDQILGRTVAEVGTLR